EALGHDDPHHPVDILDAVLTVMEDEKILEVEPSFAPNVLVGFGRVAGYSFGTISKQPSHLAGTLEIDASEKAARIVRLCDANNIPVLTVVDVPGFLPGTDQEDGGVIRRGAKLLYDHAWAKVPLSTVRARNAYGGPHNVKR